MRKLPKGLKQEARIAEALGWVLLIAGSGHMKWFDPEGVLRVTTSMTPKNGRRSVLNARSQLKKHGIEA
jgi:hypothetical protein